MTRPVGTRKRELAQAAALAVWNGEFDDLSSAAAHHRPAHIGSEDGFRNFVEYVEEAYRELIAARGVGSFRMRYGPLSERSRNRRSQTKPTVKHLREFFGDWS